MSAQVRHPTVEAVLAIHAEVLKIHGGGEGLLFKPFIMIGRNIEGDKEG